ncbi:hypothetical protein D1P53_005539 [Cryptococcus gattii VGV]|nr:hypothetical protein D1P53_005539 [Cryptococcus gattii VGV]
MQRPQPAQSSSSKRRRSSAPASQTQTEASQTQTGTSADLGLQHTANSSKRSKKNPVIDWEKDCGGESHQSSFAYFKDWIPTGIRYMSGAIGGYNLKKGAKEFQRYLYLKKGPTRRSVKSIENKYLSVKRGWQTAYNLTHETGAGDGGTVTIHAPAGDVDIPYGNLSSHRERYCPDYNFWNEIFQSRHGPRPEFICGTHREDIPSVEYLTNHSNPNRKGPLKPGLWKKLVPWVRSLAMILDDDVDEQKESQLAASSAREINQKATSSCSPTSWSSWFAAQRGRLQDAWRGPGAESAEGAAGGREEKREIERVETERARRAAEADHWRRHADYFEGQNNLAQIQMAYYRQKMRNEEVESAARISSQMSISLQEAFSVLRRARGISEDS